MQTVIDAILTGDLLSMEERERERENDPLVIELIIPSMYERSICHGFVNNGPDIRYFIVGNCLINQLNHQITE